MVSPALILEGGGFRGLYTSGVLDSFMEKGLWIPDVYAVSAGACNAIGYAAKQPHRNAEVNFRFCEDKRFVSFRNLLKCRCAFNMEFVFDTIPEQYAPFDYDTFFSSDIQVHAGTTNLLTGKSDFFTKSDMDNKMYPIRASSALPLFSHSFYLNGIPYLDGGIANPIPIGKSINSGHNKHIVVLTQDPHYIKRPTANLPLIRRLYKQYPAFISAVEKRHRIYNRQRRICALLSKTNRAIVIGPKNPVRVGSMDCSEASLRELYEQGYQDGMENIDRIFAFLASE